MADPAGAIVSEAFWIAACRGANQPSCWYEFAIVCLAASPYDRQAKVPGLVTIDEQPNGPLTMWSSKLTDEGEAVVADYCTRQGIKNPVAAARERLLDEQDPMDQVELLQQSLEGRRLLREHLIRERDPALVRQFKDQLSSFLCSVCSFDFEDVYGPIGRGFIEAHHLEPIGLRKGGTPTSIRGFIAVCSNCHRMIHRRPHPYEADEIKAMMHRPR